MKTIHLLFVAAAVCACDSQPTAPVGPAASPSPIATTSVPAAPGSAPAPVPVPTAALAPSAAAPGAVAPPPPAATTPGCDVAVRHADAVLRRTGAATLVAKLVPVEVAIAACEREAWAPEILACVLGAADARAVIYGCYARALTGAPQIKRRFRALDDNRAVQPPVLSLDGDYLAIDDRCGTLIRIMPPATAVYYVCGDELLGPMMTSDDIDEMFAALSRDEAARHRIVMDLVARTRIETHQVDTYQGGVYQGTHTELGAGSY